MIVENDYVDGDYLTDYAAYHVKCFNGYKKKTVRLLFFDFCFDKDWFARLLSRTPADNFENDIKKLTESYLGFVVVRPLPRRMLGKVALKTYPEGIQITENGTTYRRFYPAKRPIESSLFGITLKTDSLLFQEQDDSVSACATSAIFCALNKTSYLFNHRQLSPYQITRAAVEGLPITNGRTFPNEGLTSEQMLNAFASVNLEPHCVGISPIANDIDKGKIPMSATLFKEYVYAYLKSGIPIILGLHLFRKERRIFEDKSRAQERWMPLYAVKCF